MLTQLASLFLSGFAAPGFSSQRVRKLLGTLVNVSPSRLQFLDARFEPGLFGAGTGLLVLQLLLSLRQLLAHLCQLSFQFLAALAEESGLLLSILSAQV